MSEEQGGGIGGFLRGLRKKAGDKVAQRESELVRGKIAARAVVDDTGTVIVDAGHRIDDAIIQRANAAGKLHALVAATMSAKMQDLKEQARERYEHSADGQEARTLATTDAYAEARGYLGRKAAVDVTDIRGNMLVPAGKQIEDEDIRIAREAGQLAALIFSVQQSAPAQGVSLPSPSAVAQPVLRRTARPLTDYGSSSEEEQPS